MQYELKVDATVTQVCFDSLEEAIEMVETLVCLNLDKSVVLRIKDEGYYGAIYIYLPEGSIYRYNIDGTQYDDTDAQALMVS